jgi:glycogen operon protein
MHLILNAYWEPLEFELPPVADGDGDPWRRWIDTFRDSPEDIVDWACAPRVDSQTYRAEPRSVVVLFANLGSENAGGTPAENRQMPNRGRPFANRS